MPPLPVITDVFRCAFNWECDGQHAVNVMHFRANGPTPLDLATTINSSATATMFDCIVGQATVQTVDVTPLDGVSATQSFALSNWNGNSGGEQFIPGFSAIVKIQTALRGRAYNGRVFLPFISETAQQDGQVVGDWVGTHASAWQDWAAALPDDDVFLGVASYKNSTFEGAVTLTQENLGATQKRRQDRLRS